MKNIHANNKQLTHGAINLSQLEASGNSLQNQIQYALDCLSVNKANNSILFNKIKNIFLIVNTVFIKISNTNSLLTIKNVHERIDLLIFQTKDQLVYLKILKKIKKFLFVISKYEHQKQKVIILNNNSHDKILHKITGLTTVFFDPRAFLVDFGIINLVSMTLNPNIKALALCIVKLKLFVEIEGQQPNYHCNFNDLTSIVHLLNIYYSCLDIFNNYRRQSIMHKFSSKCFLKSSQGLGVPKSIIKYIIDYNKLLGVELIDIRYQLCKFKKELYKVVLLINFKLNNGLYTTS